MKLHLYFASILALFGGSSLASDRDEDVTVATAEGRVRGITETALQGTKFFSFMGIPYAKPPLGALRFKDPVASDAWDGILDTKSMPEYCVQYSMLSTMLENVNMVGTEDCLYLNVFTPKPNDVHANLPVMFFIHGGGFMAGGSREYYPQALMDEDIVLVTVNYRVYILGFLSTEDDVMPGNLGLKDQNLALRWVQNNIRHFGGDPDKVTIFGESAGSASVLAHVLSPWSAGLFTRAIMQSGSLTCPWGSSHVNHRALAITVGVALNCSLEEGKSDEFLTCLQGIDPKELWKTAMSFHEFGMMPFLFKPRVDRNFLPTDAEVLLREGKFNEVDIMSGYTRDEGAFLFVYVFGNPEMLKNVRENFDKFGPLLLMVSDVDEDPVRLSRTLYKRYVDGKPFELNAASDIQKMLAERFAVVCQEVTAAFLIKNKNINVYQYTFEHEGQYSLTDFYDSGTTFNWVSHADDLLYLFSGGGDLFNRQFERKDDLKTQKLLIKLWTNFARTGNPTPPGSGLDFEWKKATMSQFDHLKITSTPKMVKDDKREARDFHNSLATRTNKLLFPDGNIRILEEDADSRTKNEEL